MSEVAEAPVVRYEMPKIDLGDSVKFWPTGARSGRGEVAAVFGVGVNGRTINVRVLSTGQARYGVRHITDPRINENQEIRAEGAWEYTDQHETIQMLHNRITKLEDDVKCLKKDKKSAS